MGIPMRLGMKRKTFSGWDGEAVGMVDGGSFLMLIELTGALMEVYTVHTKLYWSWCIQLAA